MDKIKKRNGTYATFDPAKIQTAIMKANVRVAEEPMTEEDLSFLTQRVVKKLEKENEIPDVEHIQDIVERTLSKAGYSRTAKAYILYRAEHAKMREMRDTLPEIFSNLTFKAASEVDMKRENANINTDTAMGTMLKFGTESAKDYFDKFILPPHIAQADHDGDIHIHDKDFYTITETCCQIDLLKLFKDGFSTGHGYLREPNSIRSYAALACIAIQANQNEMHGGQAVPNFDYAMADGVRKTYRKSFLKHLAETLENKGVWPIGTGYQKLKKMNLNVPTLGQANEQKWPNVFDNKIHEALDTYGILSDEDYKLIARRAYMDTVDETHQAMEAVIHNLNSMHSRAGAQVPFSSINYGTDMSPEGQLAIREILNATEDGLGNGETPIFPVQIFKVKEGVNYNPDDPNYSLLKQAMRVSAKRLFPNFSFMDAPFNKQYLGKHPDKPWYDEVGYMGCLLCTEVLTYKVGNMLKVHSIGRAWNEFAKTHSVQKYGESEFIDLENDNVTVWDSHTKGFVKVKKWIKNPNKNNWFQLKLSSGRKLIATADHPLPTKERGRCFIKDLTLSDQIPITSTQYSPETKITPDFNTDFAWLLGVLLCDSSYAQNIMISLGNDEKDIEQQITNVIKNIPDYKFSTYTIQQNRGYKGSYRDINIKCGTKLKPFKEWLTSFFGGRRKLDRQIPDEVFSWPDEYKYAFIAGMMDADGYINSKGTSHLGSTNHELATQQMLLLQSVSIPAKCYINHYTKNKNATRLTIDFTMTDGIIEHMQSRKKVKADEHYRGKPQVIKEFASIISIEALDIDQPSYDIETESDRFDVSGVLSHNCRTRVMANVYDPDNEITPGRGNLSFTSINLPRIAIQSRNMVNEKGEFNSPTNMEKFYRILDERIDLCIEQLLHRFKIQCSKHAYNYPFLMGEGVWINSEKLSPADTLETVLKHGTLSVGFIGLAETLVALTGKHHGESEESWKLGYKIIKYMRERMDQACKKYRLNLSLLATPGEGLSGTFVRIDKKKYGIIPGVTDREYYTNSFHVPVYYNISAFDKIKKEAPFHELTNAGHISYVEVDGDIAKNLDAFEAIIRCMKESGIGYGSINHPVDRDPICGYVGIINEVCPRCGRRENEAVSLEKLEELKKKYRNMPDITKYIK